MNKSVDSFVIVWCLLIVGGVVKSQMPNLVEGAASSSAQLWPTTEYGRRLICRNESEKKSVRNKNQEEIKEIWKRRKQLGKIPQFDRGGCFLFCPVMANTRIWQTPHMCKKKSKTNQEEIQ